MKNIIILAVTIILLAVSIVVEPIDDSIDLLAGATSETYSTPDQFAGASTSGSQYDDDDDEHEDDEHEDDEHEEDDD